VEKCAAYLVPKRNLSRARPLNIPARIKSEIVLSSSTKKSRSLLNFGLDPSWPSILTIGVLAVMMALVSLASVPESIGWLGVGLAELMLAIAIIDWRHKIIPDELSYGGLVLGLGISLAGGAAGFVQALLGAAVGWGLLWLVRVAGGWVTPHPGPVPDARSLRARASAAPG